MSFTSSWKNFRSQKGWFQFVTRSLLFFIIAFGVYSFIFMYFRHTEFFINFLRIESNFYIPWLTGLRKTDFINAIAFGVIAFILWNRKSLTQLKGNKRHNKETFVFAVLSLILLVGHYGLKYAIKLAGELSSTQIVLLSSGKYVLLIGFLLSLAVTCYTRVFLKDFWKRYKPSLAVFGLIGIAYFFLIQVFQLVWYKLSYFVSVSVHWLLSLSFAPLFYSAGTAVGGPRIGYNGFLVSISNECSGVDSLLLFISLFALLIALDWRRMHLKRMAILFIPGLLMTVAYNILRIYLLMIVGILYDPQFAVDGFHSNAGWILFLIFFMIFWHFGSKWVYKKKEPEKKLKKKANKPKKKAAKKTTKKASKQKK